MFRKTTLSALLLTGSTVLAQEADLARGAVDPLDLGVQRAKFLQAAGTDTELDASEFKANAAVKDGFVRSFDKWENIIKFDKNKSGQVDWFEAAAYRQALRKGILTQFDADKNNRLAEAERTAANEALAAGRLPGLTSEAPGVATPAPAAPAPRRESARGFGGFGGAGDDAQRQQFEQFRAELLKKHDKNGDGELTGDERDAAREESRAFFQKQFTDRYDTNKDGQVDESERQAIRQEFEERGRQAREQFMQRYDKNGDGTIDEAEGRAARVEFNERRFDSNGDGKLDDTERATMERSMAEEDQRRQEIVKEFDKDGDGQLNEEERRASFEALRERGGRDGRGGFGGFGGFGGRRGGPDRQQDQ